MNKRWNMMSILVVISLLLTACVGPSAQAPSGGGDAAAGDSSTVTVTYTYPNTVFKDVGLVEEALNTLLVPAINTKIKLNPIDWGAFDEKMKLAFAAGEECDIVFTAPWINNYLLNIANGNFIPLDDLLQQHAPGLWASMPETTWDAARVDGKIYGVINQQIFVKPFGFTVRKDLADKYKLDVEAIKTYEELEPFLAAVKVGEPDVTPLTGASSGSFEHFGFDPIITEQVPVAIRYDDKELKVFNAAATPEFQGSMELARKWYLADYAPKETISGEDSDAMWRAGKFAMSLVGVVKPGGEIESEQRFGQPVYAHSMTKPFLTTAAATATTNAICSTSKNPEAAMKVLELLNTNVEVYNTLAKGVEGKHWEWADKGNLVIKPGPNNADYNPNTDWEFGNQFLAYYIDPKQAEIKAWEATYDLNTTSPPSAAMGFNFNAEPVKTELANVSAVVGELAGPLGSGQVDPATALPEYLERLNQAGIQALIDECQRQLNEWVAKQ